METNNHLEHQVKISSSNEISFLELQDNFHNVCRANNELKARLEELTSEIKKRDKVVTEWNDTLESIDVKISGLEAENSDLKRDRETLINETENMRTLLRESENLNSLLQNKCEYIEKITKQLESENKIIETLKIENDNLRHEYSKNLRHTETIAEEQKLTIIQYEQKFLRDKEIIERTVKDKYEGKLKEFQLEMHGELNKFRDLNQKINEDLSSTKVERDHYKEEIKQLRDKMQQIDNEQRRWTSSLTDKYESMLKSKQDEIEKVRNIIDEQSHLIRSYEKIIEKEKGASLERINDFASDNNELKQEVYDLTTVRLLQAMLIYRKIIT
jgi:chromosome segregation ATPase